MAEKRNIHRWIILLSASLVMAIDFGVFFSFGVLFGEILETFGESRAQSASVQSVMYGFTIGGGFIAGIVVAKLGCRNASIAGTTCVSLGFMISFFANSTLYLVLAVGVLSGAGFAILLITAFQIAGEYFGGKLRAMAISVVGVAGGLGAIIYPYIVDRLFIDFTLQGKLLITSGLFFNTVPLTYLWNPLKSAVKTENQPNLRSILSSLFKDKVFVLYTIGVALALPPLNAYVATFMDIYGDIPLDKDQCVSALLTFNIGSLIGRFLPAICEFALDSKSIAATTAFAVAGAAGSLSLIFATGSAAGAFCVAAMLGAVYGGLVTYMPIVSVEIAGLGGYAVAMGTMLTLNGILSAASGPVSGYLRDMTGSYTLSLAISSVCLTLAAVMFITSYILQSRKAQPIHPFRPSQDATIEIEQP